MENRAASVSPINATCCEPLDEQNHAVVLAQCRDSAYTAPHHVLQQEYDGGPHCEHCVHSPQQHCRCHLDDHTRLPTAGKHTDVAAHTRQVSCRVCKDTPPTRAILWSEVQQVRRDVFRCMRVRFCLGLTAHRPHCIPLDGDMRWATFEATRRTTSVLAREASSVSRTTAWPVKGSTAGLPCPKSVRPLRILSCASSDTGYMRKMRNAARRMAAGNSVTIARIAMTTFSGWVAASVLRQHRPCDVHALAARPAVRGPQSTRTRSRQLRVQSTEWLYPLC